MQTFRYFIAALLTTGDAIASSEPLPPLALRLRPELVRVSHMVWGLSAPVPLFGAQVHQESGWRSDVVSNAGARGLTQFMPETEQWIKKEFHVELGDGEALDPRWAIRAQVRYMRYLHDKLQGEKECDAMQFALSAYNGGATWVIRDRQVASDSGKNPNKYTDVEPFNSGRSVKNFRENREYPRLIIFRHQPKYLLWGPSVCDAAPS